MIKALPLSLLVIPHTGWSPDTSTPKPGYTNRLRLVSPHPRPWSHPSPTPPAQGLTCHLHLDPLPVSTIVHHLEKNTVQHETFYTLNILEMGPLRFRKGELMVTFTTSGNEVIFMKGDLFNWEGLAKVTFTKS